MKTDLQETNRNADGDTRAAQGTLVVRDRPRVTRQCLKNTCQLELTLLDWHEEACSAEALLRHRLARSWRRAILRTQPEHVLNLFRRILLATAEHV